MRTIREIITKKRNMICENIMPEKGNSFIEQF
jgi:hypothetical protein